MNMLAAQGEAILLYFSTEDVNENELWMDFLEEAYASWPIDKSRIYATGHSHYGEFVNVFSTRHSGLLAAVAQQCVSPGISSFGSSELTEKLRANDLPTIIISGTAEMVQVFPINGDAPTQVAENWRFIFPQDKAGRIEAWQKRLYSQRCPVPSTQGIEAAAYGCPVERVIGAPCDRSDILHLDGLDFYIGDFKNADGNYHFRVVAIDNFPHSACNMMHQLSWSFLRKFSRGKNGIINACR